MEVARQRGRRLLTPKYLFVEVDERDPLHEIVDEAKKYEYPVAFFYKGIKVFVNKMTSTQVIVEGWRIEWENKLTKPRLRLICTDGEEV